MTSTTKSKVWRGIIGLAVVAGGGMSAAIFPSCETIATTVNPCGTIFGFCQPTDVDLLFADIPDFDLDPTCTLPLFDPNIIGQGGGGGGVGQQLGTCAGASVYPYTPGPRPD